MGYVHILGRGNSIMCMVGTLLGRGVDEGISAEAGGKGTGGRQAEISSGGWGNLQTPPFRFIFCSHFLSQAGLLLTLETGNSLMLEMEFLQTLEVEISQTTTEREVH